MVANLRKMVLCVCLVLLPAKMFGMLRYVQSTGNELSNMVSRSYGATAVFLKKYVLFQTPDHEVSFSPKTFVSKVTGNKKPAQSNTVDLEEETVMAGPALKETFNRYYGYISNPFIKKFLSSENKPPLEKTKVNETITTPALTPEDEKHIAEIKKITDSIIKDEQSFGGVHGKRWKPDLNAVKLLREKVNALLTSDNVRKSSWNNLGQILQGVLPERVICLLIDMVPFDPACKDTVLKVLKLTDFDPRFTDQYKDKKRTSPLVIAAASGNKELIKAMLERIGKNQKRNICKTPREWDMLRAFSAGELRNQNIEALDNMVLYIDDPELIKKYFEVLPLNQISIDEVRYLDILAKRYIFASMPEKREKWENIIANLVEHGMPVNMESITNQLKYDLKKEKENLALEKTEWNKMNEEGKKFLLAHGHRNPFLITEKDLENKKKMVDEATVSLLKLLTSLEKKRGSSEGKYGNNQLSEINKLLLDAKENEILSFINKKELVNLVAIWELAGIALQKKYPQAVRVLVEKYGDKLREIINMRREDGLDTLLATAAREGNKFFVEWALKNGADARYSVNGFAYDKFVPLYTLAEGKYPKIDAMLKKAAGVPSTQQKSSNNKNFIKE